MISEERLLVDDNGSKRFRIDKDSYIMYPTSTIPFDYGGAMDGWFNPFINEVFEREYNKKITDVVNEKKEMARIVDREKDEEKDEKDEKKEEKKREKISTLKAIGMEDTLVSMLASTTLDEQ